MAVGFRVGFMPAYLPGGEIAEGDKKTVPLSPVFCTNILFYINTLPAVRHLD